MDRAMVVLVSNPFSALAGWATKIVESLGYVGVVALLALENIVPPIPSEVVLPLAGFLVGQGRFAFVWVVAAATLGSLLGALVLYGLGWWLGEDRVRALAERAPFFGGDDVDKAHDWFERHGGASVFFGRLVPGVRSLISIPAGFERMSPWRFVLYTILGSGLWNAVLIGAGWALGSQWQRAQRYAEIAGYVAVAALVVFVGHWLWQRRSRATAS
jgi:membrane protein DedA with SNARE-associated domain